MISSDQYVLCLFGLLLWREARGRTIEEITAVACSVRNRVKKQGYMGKTYVEVITHKAAYSSFPWINVRNEPVADLNGTTFPNPADVDFQRFLYCCGIADNVIKDITADAVAGATHYYDKSDDANPPSWTKEPTSKHIKDIGDFRFWIAN